MDPLLHQKHSRRHVLTTGLRAEQVLPLRIRRLARRHLDVLQPRRALDRSGLIGPLTIAERTSPIAYNREYTVLLDDCLSSPPVPPEAIVDSERDSGMMGGFRIGSRLQP